MTCKALCHTFIYAGTFDRSFRQVDAPDHGSGNIWHMAKTQ